MKLIFIIASGRMRTAVGVGGNGLVEEESVNWNDRVHLCLRSGRRGVRAAHLFTGVLDEAIDAALARPVEERERLIIKYEFSSLRLSWNRIAELARRPDFPMLI